MRHFIRRALIFPMFLIFSPVFYSIAWLFDGHEVALSFAKYMVTASWGKK